MESNHHGCFHPQAPHPCASTSPATAAEGHDSRCSAFRPPARLRASGRPPRLRTRVRKFFGLPRRAPRGGAELILDLTKRQKKIFDFIGKYAAKTGYPPTVREIGKAVGLHSSSTVHAHLANLQKIGLLRGDPRKPR